MSRHRMTNNWLIVWIEIRVKPSIQPLHFGNYRKIFIDLIFSIVLWCQVLNIICREMVCQTWKSSWQSLQNSMCGMHIYFVLNWKIKINQSEDSILNLSNHNTFSPCGVLQVKNLMYVQMNKMKECSRMLWVFYYLALVNIFLYRWRARFQK